MGLSRRGFLLYCRKGAFAQSPLGLFAHAPQGLVAALSLKPRRLFISLHEQRNEAKKFAVCTFLPTPALFSTKQKELADAQTAFCFLRSEKHLRFTAKN